MDPSLFQDALDGQSYGFSSMGALAWVCYDIIIAIDQEVEHVWQARWSPAKVLYLLARYVSVVALVLYWLTEAVPNLPASLCQTWPIVSGIIMVIVGVSVDLIQLLRVRAIYNANRKVTIPLYLFFAGVLLAAIIVIVTGNSNSLPDKTVYVLGCVDNHSSTATLAAWIAEMALGGVFFFLTVWKLHPYFGKRTVRTPFLTAVVEGGVLFYIVIFVAEILNTIFVQTMSDSSRLNLVNITEPWAIAVYGIAGPRLILHLRGAMTNFADLSDARPVHRTGETALVATQAHRRVEFTTPTATTATSGSTFV